MTSNESSSNSAASGSQGTGLWVTAAIAMAIIVGGPMLIHSGAERGHRGGQAVDQKPATEVVSSAARPEIEGSSSVGGATREAQEPALMAGEGGVAFSPGIRATERAAEAALEDQEPVAVTGGGGIAFSPGTPTNEGAAQAQTPDVAAMPAKPEPSAGPPADTSQVGSSVGTPEPVATDRGASSTGPKEMAGTEPTAAEEPDVESGEEPVAASVVTGEAAPPPQESVSAAVSDGVEPPKVDEHAQAAPGVEEPAGVGSAVAPSRDSPGPSPIVGPDQAAAAKSEPAAGQQHAPVGDHEPSSRLANVMAELRSMQREVEMEQRASEGAGSSYPIYGRPYYPFRPAPGAPPSGYGYNRQGSPRYYPPQARPWGYPSPVPQGAGQLR